MVKPFQFSKLPSIIFGVGKFAELPGIIRKYGTTALIITGKKSFLCSHTGQKFLNQPQMAGISLTWASISDEPSADEIDRLADIHRNKNVKVVVAIGGGSVLDAGKAISAMITVQGSVITYLEGVESNDHPGTKIPFIAIPTTSGTGSEATKNAVISRIGKDGFKRSLRHENFVPDIALVDPELTLSCPPELTAASGMDCFTQLVEAFLSYKANVYTDALALEGIRSLKSSLTAAYEHGSDLRARTGMSFAALTSGICLANSGLGVVHGFASSIGGMYKLPHGLICGTLMGAANEITVRELRRGDDKNNALNKYAVLGRIFLDQEGRSDDFYIDGFIEKLKELTVKLKLALLKEAGIEEKDIPVICEKTENKNNPVKLGKEQLIEILTNRYS